MSFKSLARISIAASVLLTGMVKTSPAGDIRFREVQVGFKHHSPLTNKRHTHLFMGSGIGWIDYDNDGWSDLFCAQGQDYPTDSDSRYSDRLFKNRAGSSLVDTTDLAGISNLEYSMGLAIGDYNSDGFDDIYVSCYGPNKLFHNNGDGTFDQVKDNVHDGRYSASTTWVDVDNDGHLDLFVTNYVDLGKDTYQLCTTTHRGKKFYIACHPRFTPAVHNVLYRNTTDGSQAFIDATSETVIAKGQAWQSLGVVAADLDQDGDCDLYVANDSVPNRFFTNEGGKFRDDSLLCGASLNGNGQREAGMGVAVGDLDLDGSLDLMVTNFYAETNTFYRNDGDLVFFDATNQMGLGVPCRLRLGFGLSLLDADNDGAQDIFVANGHIHDRLDEMGRNEPFAQKPSLLKSNAGRRFSDVTSKSGTYFRNDHVGRGSAIADFNHDGRQDLVVGHLDREAILLMNETDTDHSWIALRLVGVESNRNGIGALVKVTSVGDEGSTKAKLIRPRIGSDSYLSNSECWLTIGLGTASAVESVEIVWPGGQRQTLNDWQLNQRYVVVQGKPQMKTVDLE